MKATQKTITVTTKKKVFVCPQCEHHEDSHMQIHEHWLKHRPSKLVKHTSFHYLKNEDEFQFSVNRRNRKAWYIGWTGAGWYDVSLGKPLTKYMTEWFEAHTEALALLKT